MRTTNKNQSNVSAHYNEKYWEWQKRIGEFGGRANRHKFSELIKVEDCVIDFGCGGGYLLASLNCQKRIGIEPNRAVASQLRNLDIQHFQSCADARKVLGVEVADVIISNHALEHVLNPLEELRELRLLLKPAGQIVFYVPCDSFRRKYSPDNIDRHLYSWSPQNIGNLFSEAGYRVILTRPRLYKWPPGYTKLAKLGNRVFRLLSLIWGQLDRSWVQIEIRAVKEA